MMRKMWYFILIFLGFSLLGKGQDQKVVATCGGSFISKDFHVSYTLGEPVINTIESGTLKLMQGFQQGNLIVTTVKEFENVDFDLKVYPNPTQDFVFLSANNPINQNCEFQMMDASGKIIQKGKIEKRTTKFNLRSHVAATYYLNVFYDNHLKVFKIIKK